jgi:outer membrane protein OmpA-like peptidoglycan-associated protein
MHKSLYILIVFFVLAGIDTSAQNLVLNYNFDNAFTCPHHYTTTAVKELVPHWTNPNKGTPDHFHACSDSLAGVPDNFAGFIYPFDGRAYVGLILREVFDSTHKNVQGVSREYLQTRLTEPMMRNKLYCVSLYYAHASRSAYAVDALGVAITRDQIRTRDPGNIVQMPQVINRPGRIMNNKESWKELCGVYRARGNEKYLTIGNFLNNEYTRFEKNLDEMTDSTFIYAYYYIDAVRVFEIENHFECGCSEEDSFGMDMMADNYDPKTGYNSLNYTRRLEEDMASMTELGDGNADDLLSDGSLSDSDGDGNADDLLSDGSLSDSDGDGNADDLLSDGSLSDSDGDADNLLSDGSLSDSDGDGNADDLLSDGSLSDSDGNADDLLSDGSLSDSDGDGNADDLLSDGSLSDSDGDGNADDLLSDGSLSDSDGDDNADKTDVLYSGDFDGREQVPGSGFYNPYAHLSSEISDEAFETIKIGDSFRLNRIFFEFNSAELLTPSFIELDRLSEILINRENILIEIHGHTDNIGSTSYNRRLSNRRAEAVYDYLHEKGVGKHQMKYKGFGSSEPVADNETNQGRSENRRVEIMISDL